MCRLLCLWLLAATTLLGQSVADSFCYPVSPYRFQRNDTEKVDCNYRDQIQDPGNYYLDQQSYLQYNSSITSDHQYHLGSDLNGNGGASSDLGDPVFVPANGRVILVRNISYSDSWGKVIVIRHLLPTGQVINSLYGHLGSILVSEGQNVSKGHKIGTIGDGNGYYPNQAHLHFEMFLEPKVPDGKGWGDVSQLFRGYIDSPDSTNVHGSFDPIFFIKTEMAKNELGIETGLFLNYASLQPGGCNPGSSLRNYILNQFTNMRPESLFVIPRTDTYRFGALPLRASEAAKQGLISPYIWERVPKTDGTVTWEFQDLLNLKGQALRGNFWVCPTVELNIAHYGVGWHKLISPDNEVSIIPLKSGTVSVRNRYGSKRDEAASGSTGTVNYVMAPYEGPYDGFDRSYVDFDKWRPRDGYVANPWLMPRIELQEDDYPPGVCASGASSYSASNILGRGKETLVKLSAIPGVCEPKQPTDAIVSLGEPYCAGEVPSILVTVSGATGADYVRVYRNNSFIRELAIPLYPFTDQGEAGQVYEYRAVAWNDVGNAGSNTVVSSIFPNCSTTPPPPSSSLLVTTGTATREQQGELKFTGTFGPSDSDVDWWFEFGADPARLVSHTEERTNSSTAPRDVAITWHGFVCEQLVYYRLVGRNNLGTSYGETYSINTALCGEAPRIAGIEGGMKDGSIDQVHIVVETYSPGLDFYAWIEFGTDPNNLTNRYERFRIGSGDELDEDPWWVFHNVTVRCGVPYYFRGHAENALGQAESDVFGYTLACPGAPQLRYTEQLPHPYDTAVKFKTNLFTSGGNPTEVWFEYSLWTDDVYKSRRTTKNTIPGVNHYEDHRDSPRESGCGLVFYFQAVAQNSYGVTRSPSVRAQTACQ